MMHFKGLLDTVAWTEEQHIMKDTFCLLLAHLTAECIHLLHAVRSIQMIADLTKGTYKSKPAEFDLNRLLSHLSMRYVTVVLCVDPTMSGIIVGDEASKLL